MKPPEMLGSSPKYVDVLEVTRRGEERGEYTYIDINICHVILASIYAYIYLLCECCTSTVL